MDDFFGEQPPQDSDVQDFLRREQEALGDDGGMFGDAPVQRGDAGDGFDFNQGGDAGFGGDNAGFGGGDNAGFGGETFVNEASEPVEDSGVPEGQTPFYQSKTQYVDPYSAVSSMESTPQPLVEWKKQQEKLLQEKDQKADEKNKKSLEEAKVSLDQFYAEYHAKTKERKKKNRTEQEAFVSHRDKPQSGKPWEAVNDLVDLTTKGQKSTRDVSRMRTIFVQLKASPSAPGA